MTLRRVGQPMTAKYQRRWWGEDMAFDERGNFVLTDNDARLVITNWLDKLKVTPAQFADDVHVNADRFASWLNGNAALSDAELATLSDNTAELIAAERLDVERELAAYGATSRNSWSILGLMGKK